MKMKSIGAFLYILAFAGVCFTLPSPARASCDSSCFLQRCSVGAGGTFYGWIRTNGDGFVTLNDPARCQFPNNLYVSCRENNWGCSSASSGTYKVEGSEVFVWDDKGQLKYSIPAEDFNARHQKELSVATIRTCSGRYR